MPKDFEECVKNGGKLRRKNLKGNKYINICYDKNGKSYSGEVKTKKKNNKQSKAEKQQKQINDSRKLAASLTELQKHFNNNYRI
jgi:hypothetical protein